jgi:hypothetical protein
MAIVGGGALGTTAHATSASSFTHTTAVNNISAGQSGLLTVTGDNLATTDGASNDHVSVTGGTGDWTKLGEYTNSPTGAAGDGVTISLWLFYATAANNVGTVFTINLSGNITDKCALMWGFTHAANTRLTLTTGITNPITSEVNGANGFGSSAFSGLSNLSRLYFRTLGKEANSTTALTQTSGYTLSNAIRSRNNAAAQLGRGEFRIITATGETSNPTLAVSGDTAGLFVALEEATFAFPATGDVTAAGLAPTVTATNNILVTAALGAVTAAGVAPTVTATNHQTVTPALGAATIAGLAPTFSTTNNQTVTPALGDVTAAGLEPTVTASQGVAPSPALGDVTAAGLAPTASVTANALVRPDLGEVAAEGIAPTASVTNHQTVTPDLGAATIAGLAPTAAVTDYIVVLPAVGAVTAAGLAPTFATTDHVTVTPGTGELTIAGLVPTFVNPILVTPDLGAVTAAGFAPTITVAVTVTPATGTATIAGLEPTVLTPLTVTPAVGAATVAGLEPTVLTPVTVVSATGELDATGFEPVVTATVHAFARPGVGTLDVVGYAPDIDTGATEVFPGPAELTIRGLRPTVMATRTDSTGRSVSIRTADWADFILKDGGPRRGRRWW